jgi:sialic acid synthase SpsE
MNEAATVSLSRHQAGRGEPVLIVAECGINHNGQLDMALRMIERAAAAGADGVKFQLFRADGMYTPKAGLYPTARGELMPIYQLMEEMQLPESWLAPLSQTCRNEGLEFIMTVCDEQCVALMDGVDFDAYKVASYEVAHLPMLEAIARRDKPVFLSTGSTILPEIYEAMTTLSPDQQRPVGLFQCTAKYPAPPEALHLRVIGSYARLFPHSIPGFSDHSIDPLQAPVQAVYHGAKVIEKHFTLDRNLPGADHSFAVEESHLRAMVAAIREAEAQVAAGEIPVLDEVMGGQPDKHLGEVEGGLRHFAYRGIFTLREIQPAEPFTSENLRVLRPGELPQGLHPRHYAELLSGRCASRLIPPYTGLQWADVADCGSLFGDDTGS